MNQLTKSIEAILFAVSEPQSFTVLANRLGVTEDEIKSGLDMLAQQFENHGIALMIHNNTATLVTRPEQSVIIESIRKEELQKELSKASAETLSIIAYYPGATKAQIEFIRGVNTSYSLRALQIRGLIEQRGNGRTISYHPTMEMLEYFGVQSIEQLPNFAEIRQKIVSLIERENEQETV